MDITRLMLTGFAGLAVVLAAACTVAFRRAHEAERSQDAAEVARLEGTVRDLAGQLRAAARGLRRLRVLEAVVELMR